MIDHNKSAINFYIKNNFEEAEKFKHYYCINDALFDARIFYKIIKDSNIFLNQNRKNQSLNNSLTVNNFDSVLIVNQVQKEKKSKAIFDKIITILKLSFINKINK